MSATPVVQLLVGVGYTTDITSLLSIKLPVSVTRGRSDEFSDVQPSVMTLTLDISTTTPPAALVVGAPIRLRATVNGVTTNRFTGTVDSVTVNWPSDSGASSTVTVTGVDLMASLNRRKLPATLTATIMAAAPSVYWPMHEAEGATSAGDLSGKGGAPLMLAQRGTGGTFSMGSGDGAPTQSLGCATFERASATAGPYLTTTLTSALPVAPPGTYNWGFLVTFVVASSTVAAQTFVRLRRPDTEPQDGAPLLDIGCDGSGYLRVSSAFKAGVTNSSTIQVCDGLPHHVSVFGVAVPGSPEIFTTVWRIDGGVGAHLGGAVSTGGTPWPGVTVVEVGGSLSTGANQASASISDLAYFPISAPTTATDDIGKAATTGFTTDRTDQRIGRYLDWLGITARSLETGSVTATAHQDTTDLSPVAAMNAVAATERGLVFVDASGQVTFHSRTHRYGTLWTALLDADALDESLTFTTDTQSLINKVTASRPFGSTVTFSDPSSITAYGEYPTEVELLISGQQAPPTPGSIPAVTNSGALEAFAAAAWMVNTNSTPRPRVSTVGVDLLTQTPAIAAQMQALELGSLIGLIGLPSQAPSGALSLFVEGWTETISLSEWTMQLNTSPNDSPLKLDSAYGALDYWRLV
mgnify:FL=1